jgi:hypothetical protein
MVKVGTPGLTYFSVVTFFNIRLANFPTTCTVVGSFFFLPDFLRHSSLIVFVSMGMFLIAYNKGIFTQMFFSSFNKS